jgi:hypothetical protein
MRTTTSLLIALAAFATPAFAQNNAPIDTATKAAPAATTDSSAAKKRAERPELVQGIEIQRLRAVDQRGINVYETPKTDGVPYTGFKLGWGAAFTQQFQGLGHYNTAAPNVVGGVNRNQLQNTGHGFNNAVANLYLNAQLAKGIRVSMSSYLSSRHHQETWVKDGYLQIDDSPIDHAALNKIMQYVTIKAGHMEINYGDEHFRRTDNGNAMYNPFVGNLLLDAFTTEIGGEVYLRKGPWMAMGGVFGGETRGQVTARERRAPAYLGKVGFDKELGRAFGRDVRFRVTGSYFTQARSNNQSLFTGDRGGSRYYQVMVNTAGTEKDSAWTGNVQPGIRSGQHAWVVNPFLKVGGLELRANVEETRGRNTNETTSRQWNQLAGEGLYRFLDDRLFVGGRYNTVEGTLPGATSEVTVDRTQFGAGWFITPTVLLKGEWMQQLYKDFAPTDIRNGGKIKGFVLEGVVAF